MTTVITDRASFFDSLAEAVVTEVRREIPHRRDLCILSTRVGWDACNYFGVPARPMPVRTLAFNQRWSSHIETVGNVEDESWEKAMEEGAWSIFIDEEDHTAGKYPGHLVLVSEQDGDHVEGRDDWFLDLSLGQFTRPQYDMNFPDSLTMRVDLPAIESGEAVVFRTDDLAYVTYRFRVDAPDWRRGADWRRKQPISGRVIRSVRDTLLSRR